MHSRLRPILAWGLLFAISLFAEDVLNYHRLLFKLLPFSVMKLEREMWAALGMTFAAAVLAWFVAVGAGLILGIVVSSTLLDESKRAHFLSFGTNVNMVMEAFYVIPFVLTVTLSYTITFVGIQRLHLPGWAMVVILIAVAGMALGGYNVYRTVYASVTAAKADNRLLTNSLYFRKNYVVGRLLRSFSKVKRLHDCEVQSLWSALELAAHLSIVGVMIVEAVIPGFYETAFPSTGISPPWKGGAGRLILTLQNASGIEQISGVIWVVLAFDLLFTTAIAAYCRRKWQRYYNV